MSGSTTVNYLLFRSTLLCHNLSSLRGLVLDISPRAFWEASLLIMIILEIDGS